MSHFLKEIYFDLKAAETIKKPDELPYCAEVLDADGVTQARQMLAEVYAAKGLVAEHDLAADGTLNDEADLYWHHAIYYGVRDKTNAQRLLMAARLIVPEADDINSLQIHLDEIDPAVRDELYAQNPATVAEFASYVKEPGLDPLASRLASLYLIRQMIRDSRSRDIQTWVFGLRPELQKKYERIFGPAMTRCGTEVHLGHFDIACIPYRINVEESWRRLRKSSRWRLGSVAIANFVGADTFDAPNDGSTRLFKRDQPST